MRATALQKGLRILEMLESCRSMRFKDIQAQIDSSPATLSAIMGTLLEQGYVCKDTNGYSLGTRFLSTAMAVLDRCEVRHVGLPFLYRLRDQTQETVELMVPNGDSVYVAAKVEAVHPIELNSRLGLHLYNLHIIAPGKLLLARQSEAERQAFYQSDYFRQKPVDLAALEKQLPEIRRNNSADDHGWTFNGVTRLASPILDFREELLGMVTVVLRAERATTKRRQQLSNAVFETARLLSRKLGFEGEY